MAFYYNKLWDVAYKKKLNKTALRDKAGITNATLARLSKNQPVSMAALEKLCICLKCDIGDIVEYKNEIIVGGDCDA